MNTARPMIDLPGQGAPAAGFEVPLEMLSACHGRVERQCQTLRRLVPHLAAHGSDADARKAASNVMRYFDTAAQDHHADEEADLFPALLQAAAGDDAERVPALVALLLAEHRELATHWQQVRATLVRVAAGEPVTLEAAEVEALVTRYEKHIACEEEELLPLAGRLLDLSTLDDIGRAMRRRRGLADAA
jgi:hemerythrin-like domain-containing protein